LLYQETGFKWSRKVFSVSAKSSVYTLYNQTQDVHKLIHW